MWELLPQEARTTSLEMLDKAVDTKLWIDFDQQVNVIRHHFHFQDVNGQLRRQLGSNVTKPRINAVDQDGTPIFWAKDNLVFTGVDNVVIAFEFGGFDHTSDYTAWAYLVQMQEQKGDAPFPPHS
jgi:hypothetical protein